MQTKKCRKVGGKNWKVYASAMCHTIQTIIRCETFLNLRFIDFFSVTTSFLPMLQMSAGVNERQTF